ncbi:MAG: hypothetical protein HQL51_16650 [Magnetococcales bacterium]|nr:hypothetical protein [Magnetococcales bacterium]
MNPHLKRLREALRKVVDQVDQMSTRERVMMLAILSLLFIAVWYFSVLLPYEKAVAQAGKDEVQLNKEIAQNRDLEQMLRNKKQADPNAEYRERLKKAEAALAKMDGRMNAAVQSLATARDMTRFLRALLDRTPELRLLALGSTPPASLGKADAAEGKETEDGKKKKKKRPEGSVIYKHGLTLVLEGDFLTLLGFLQKLEAERWMVYWDLLNLNVLVHPAARVVLRLHTLSLDDPLVEAE